MENINFKDYPILFIDDELDVLETISTALKNNFTVDTSNDPQTALEMVKEK